MGSDWGLIGCFLGGRWFNWGGRHLRGLQKKMWGWVWEGSGLSHLYVSYKAVLPDEIASSTLQKEMCLFSVIILGNSQVSVLKIGERFNRDCD